jgi:hypothetical protein
MMQQDIDTIMYLYEEAKEVQKMEMELQQANAMGGMGGMVKSFSTK